MTLRLRREIEGRRQIRELLDRNDDLLLRDIGLTRTDLQQALDRPFEFGLREEMARLSREASYLDGSRFRARR